MEPRISFVTLGVKNFQRSVAFYRDGLGFPLSSASKGDIAFFKTRVAWYWPCTPLTNSPKTPRYLRKGQVFGA